MRLVALAAVCLMIPALAQAQSAGSFSATISNVSIVPEVTCLTGTLDPNANLNCNSTAQGFLSLNIKTSSGSGTALLVQGSLQTSLLTNTMTSTGGGTKQSASSFGAIVVDVAVDGVSAPTSCVANCPPGVAYPPSVVFDERLQTLSTTLGQLCQTDPTTGTVVCNGDQSVELLLGTTSAHSFQFVVPGLTQGTHRVDFRIAVATTGGSSSIAAGSKTSAVVGVGSLTAQVVKVQTPFDAIRLGSGDAPSWQF